MITKPWHSYSY